MSAAQGVYTALNRKVCVLIVIIFVDYIFHNFSPKSKMSIFEKFLFIYERKLSIFGGIISLNKCKVNREENVFP